MVVSAAEVVSPGHETIPGWGAAGRAGVPVPEIDPLRNEPVQIWRRDHLGGVIDGQIGPGHIVGIDQKNVRAIKVISLI